MDIRPVHRVRALCRRALAINPDFRDAQMNLGNAMASQGQYEDALAIWRTLTDKSPDDAQAWEHTATPCVKQDG